MAIDFKSKFDELFGQEDVRMSAPTLRDVAPGLVDRGGSRFSSKELNPRRTAVSARDFRNPRVRSKEGAFERGGAVAQGGSFGPVSNDNNFYLGAVTREMEAGPGPGGGIGGTGVEGGNAFGGNIGGELGTAMGNEAAMSMGISGLSSAALGGLGALGMGASGGQAASAALGSGILGVTGMTGVMGLAGLANSIGGTVASGIQGSNTASTMGLDPQGEAASAAQGAVSSPFGALGMLGNEALAALGFTQSTSDTAMDAAMATNEGLTAAQESGLSFGLDAASFGTTAPSNPDLAMDMSSMDNSEAPTAMDAALAAAPAVAFGANTMGAQSAMAASAPDTGNFGGRSSTQDNEAMGIGTSGGAAPGGSMGPAGTPGAAGMASGPGGGGGGGGGK